MTNEQTENAPDDDPLRLTICPTCFYNLQGLPLEGICPECGNAYDQSGVVVYGWTPREAEERAQRPIWRWIHWTIIAGCFVVALWDSRRGPGFLLIWALIVGGMSVLRLLQRRALHAPARLQIRFDREGIHINPKTGEFGFGRTRFVPWRKVAQFSMTPHTTGGYFIHATSRYVPFTLMREYLQVVIELTEAQRSALYERVERWRREAVKS